jgi:hypothetical protein
MKKIIIVIVVIVSVAGCALFVQHGRNSDSVETALSVRNESQDIFSMVAISWDKHVLVQKTNGDEYYFPKELLTNVEKVSIIGVKSDGETVSSGTIPVEPGKIVSITKMNGNKLELSEKAEDSYTDEIKIPDLSNWKIEEDGEQIKSSYSGKTDYAYTLYVLGKGGSLGTSDKIVDGTEAIASWEKPSSIEVAWILLEKE